jgi:hypothetical protein
MRENMVKSKNTDHQSMKFTNLPRPNNDLLEDAGVCLTKAPKIELTPEGYTFEAHELSL